MIVLQVCAYGAEYSGNFIASLEALEKDLKKKNIQTIYAFIGRAADKNWCREIQKRTKVYFLPEAKARIHPKTYLIFKKIYAENKIDIVHTHFELYDIPATLMAPESTKVFWHLHDPLTRHKGLRGMLWKYQYGIVGKRATLLSVAEQYRDYVVLLGFPYNQTHLLLNSINLNRVNTVRSSGKHDFQFLTFGWDFYRKGDDIMLNVCKRLNHEGYQFRFLLNGNDKTWGVLQDYLKGEKPEYLDVCNPVEDINELFGKADVFIQASRRETFSYAVCEAAYAGMPVISSDIAGLEWAHDLPSVFFFENENEEQLYQLMKAHLNHSIDLDPDIITQTRTLIEKEYSLTAWTKKVMSFYGVEQKEGEI